MTWSYPTATELARAIARRELSCEEAVRQHLARIDAVNAAVNAVVARLDDEALADARRADAELARGSRRGPLHGVPVTIKESLAMAGKLTTCGSLSLRENRTPADATVVARLRAAGAIPIGRTNVPDMGLDAQTHNLVWGVTRNPWNLAHTSGGSSGGEGAAIALGMSPLGLGSDVGGSIRIPAAFCGIVGLKPTQFRVPVTGHVPYVLLDYLQIGPLARSIDDLEVALTAIAGPDGVQSTVPPVPLRPSRELESRRLRIGVCEVEAGESLPVARSVRDAIGRAARAASDLGHEVTAAAITGVGDVVAALGPIFALAVKDLAASVRRTPDTYHPYLGRLADSLPLPTLEQLAEGFRMRDALRTSVMETFSRHDVVICPQAAVPAFPLGTADEIECDGARIHLMAALAYSLLTNCTGNPSLIVPATYDGGLPIGVQLIAGMWQEPTLFALARPLLAELGGIRHPPEPPPA